MNGPAPTRTRWPAWLAIAGLLLVLGGYNRSIHQRETLLARGQPLRLELAPRDPRSLLTGDYMTLDYRVARESQQLLRAQQRPQAGSQRSPVDGAATQPADAAARPADTAPPERSAQRRPAMPEFEPHDGYLIVKADARGVAQLVRVQRASEPLAVGELRVRYRYRKGRVAVGTNAYFFEEGSAGRYEPARFGEYRVDAQGEMLLVRLLNEKLEAL